MSRPAWISVGLVFVIVVVVASGLVARRMAEARADAAMTRFVDALDAALARQDTALARLSARFETIDDLKTAQELRLRRYQNAAHVRTARALGVARVEDETAIARLVEAGRLVPLTDTAYYYVQPLDSSVPYVTPDAAALLRRIGERFQAALRDAGLPRYRYVISSVLRTGANQRALRQINPNAALGVSSHEFGTTLDVVYHTFVYRPRAIDVLPPTPYAVLNTRLEPLRIRAYDALGMRYWQELQGLLGRVLIEMQDQGHALVLLERQQPVFHLTVAERLFESSEVE